MYFEGLDQAARVVKTPRRVSVVLEDGTVLSPRQARQLDADARRARYGALNPQFARAIRKAPASAVIKTGFWFRFDPLSPRDQKNLRSRDDAERWQAQAALRESIRRGRARVEPVLRQHGVTIERSADTIPLVFGSAVPSVLEAVSRAPGTITQILSAEHGIPVLHAAKNGVNDAQIDGSFNAHGYFGRGQRIAIIEDARAGLYETHEAFSRAWVNISDGTKLTYQVEPPACSVPADCPDNFTLLNQACEDLNRPGFDKQCVTRHASQVVSVAAGSNGGDPWGVGRARFFYPNEPVGSLTNMCNPAGLVNAYDWLTQPANGVTTVIESFGCQSAGTFGVGAFLEGLVEDWYARHFDISIMKSAGNMEPPPGYIGDHDPDQPACPYSLNSTCVGGNLRHGTAMWCRSSFTNNNGPPSGERTDREEPDITMFSGHNLCPGTGENVEVMRFEAGPTAWTTAMGTSFAAPAAAALGALCKEAAGGALGQHSVRAILKAAAHARNITDFNYSLTSASNLSSPDWYDGGGNPLGGAVMALCGGPVMGGGPPGEHGEDEGDLGGGVEYPFDPGSCEHCDQNEPPYGGQSLSPMSEAEFEPGDNRLYVPLSNEIELHVGDRIRAVLVWNSCPEDPEGTAPALVATDYDLVLSKDNVPIASSQSVSDVTEGFDFTIPSGGDGIYQIWRAHVEGSEGCGAAGNEPHAWAIYAWH